MKPPGTQPTPNGITGTPKAELRQATADRILAAARRRQVWLTGQEVRHLMRAYDVPALTDIDLDRLMRELPLGLRRPRKTRSRGWAVTS